MEQLLPVFDAEGIRALAFIPLIYTGRLFGKFMLYFDEPHPFSEEEVRLAETVARHVAFAVGRSRTEAELTYQKSLLQAQGEASLDGVLVVSPSGEILWHNPRFRDMWGISDAVMASGSDEAAIQAVLDRLVDPAEFLARVAEIYRDPEARTRDRVRLRDGRIFDRYSSPVRGHDGTLYGRVWFFRDVTAEEQAYEAERDARAEAERANQAKDEFLGLMSHELRTPITALYGGVEILRRRGEYLDESALSGLVDDMGHEAERLYRLVEDLLILSRLELGQQVATQPVLVDRILDKLTAEFRQRYPRRLFTVTVEPGLPPAAGEPTYLQQTLRNLLSNAEKYADPAHPIEVRVAAGGRGILVTVADRGQAIGAEEAARFFDPSYRSGATARTARGVGMGLTVCRRLIEAQGGAIRAMPREGGGLAVEFTLAAAGAED